MLINELIDYFFLGHTSENEEEEVESEKDGDYLHPEMKNEENRILTEDERYMSVRVVRNVREYVEKHDRDSSLMIKMLDEKVIGPCMVFFPYLSVPSYTQMVDEKVIGPCMVFFFPYLSAPSYTHSLWVVYKFYLPGIYNILLIECISRCTCLTFFNINGTPALKRKFRRLARNEEFFSNTRFWSIYFLSITYAQL